MKQLNLPEYSFRSMEKDGIRMIFDPVRRKYVKLTPEEWVRQNFVQYLIREGKYPAGLIGIEVMFNLFKTKKRIDILIHNRSGEPVMIVECKAPDVKINDLKISDQIIEYNMALRVPYLLLTNGMEHLACKITDHEKGTFEYLMVIPQYEDLLT